MKNAARTKQEAFFNILLGGNRQRFVRLRQRIAHIIFDVVFQKSVPPEQLIGESRVDLMEDSGLDAGLPHELFQV